ncbi:hypothetical protein FRC07_006010 [Ceratobasidium sp. 392]|nr:hypothetical protein FRC07_006010 [Ceratobasidium sp. 392]
MSFCVVTQPATGDIGVRCPHHSTPGTLSAPSVPISTGAAASGQPSRPSTGATKRKSGGAEGGASSQSQSSNEPPPEAYDRPQWSPLQRQRARVTVKELMLKICQQNYHDSTSKSVATRTTYTRAEQASLAQHSGYMRLLTITSGISRASDLSESCNMPPPPPLAPPPPTKDELLTRHMAEVDGELRRGEELTGFEYATMGTVDLVDFWKHQKQSRRHEFPLLYMIAMNVLPVQASSVSSERAFSSSKMTCTRERNNILAETMECLQVLKHALHRRRSTSENHQTLDFMAHVVGSDVDEENED